VDLSSLTGNPLLFGGAVIGSTFILEDPTTITVAALITNGDITFWQGLLPLTLGIFLGDLGLYVLGVGIRKGFRSSKLVPIVPGTVSVVLARFVPGMRTITFTSAGSKEFPLGKFLLLTFPSTVIWTLLLVKATEQVIGLLHYYPTWVNVLIGILIFVGIQVLERRIRRRLEKK
jgi:membrane protein DedA with SNARE-associated domain